MAVARVNTLEPLHTTQVPVQPAALVIGGGVAGMTAALALAEGGFAVHLVERQPAARWKPAPPVRHRLRRRRAPGAPRPPGSPDCRRPTASRVHVAARLVRTSGFVGDFTSVIEEADGSQAEVRHGVTIVATGGQEYRGPEYSLGESPRIVTGLDFEGLLALAEDKLDQAGPQVEAAWEALGRRLPDEVAFIQCVGPAERYCSRICCTTALKNAIRFKKLRPSARVVVLYRDIRTYGFKEHLYTEARAGRRSCSSATTTNIAQP